MKITHIAITLYLAFFAINCASTEPAQFSTKTSEPVPVNPISDNSSVLDQLTYGLLIVIDINDNMLSLTDVQVAMVPKSVIQQPEGEVLNITGMSSGEKIITVSIPDQRVNVEENKGLVMMKKRTLIGTLPLPRRIDTIEIQLPGEVSPQRFNVSEEVDRFCKKYPRNDICRSDDKK